MEKLESKLIENQEMKEVLQKLEDYVAQGYFLHGSKNKIEVLEPRQARDDNQNRKAGNLNAVYASDDIRISIFMALFDKKDTSQKGWRAFYSSTSDEEMKVGGENVTFTPGYVHVLPREKFQELQDEKDKEIVAFEKVSPVDVIQVTPDILNLISGITYEMK